VSASKKIVVVVPPVIDPNQTWFTVAEAAIYIRRGAQFVRTLLHSGQLKASSVGGYLINRADLDKLIRSHRGIIPPYRKNTRPWVKARFAKARLEKAA
jgi:excisionase family DNA binding protein